MNDISFPEAIGLDGSPVADASVGTASIPTSTASGSPAFASPVTPSPFESLGLAAPLVGAVTQLGYTQPTPVQARAIPAALGGGDWMVSSKTGSGKTASFLLPLLHRLLHAAVQAPARVPAPRAVVLCPTRELAQQVSDDAIGLMRGVSDFLRTQGKQHPLRDAARGLRVATVVGGMPFGKQIFDLRGAQIVIATPGRLLDLHARGQIRLDAAQALVVDEADRMLDLGFAEDLAAIQDATAQREQTLMFSATFAPRIMALAAKLMREPGRLELASAQDVHADITQTLHWADNMGHKQALLEHWLRDADVDQALVFASTQVDTEAIAEALQRLGHSAVALHGAMPQAVRNRRLQNVRDGRVRVLVATDVAARGLDVPSISHVINFGLPMKAEDYVHRIGRTGRAGRSGMAITIAEHRDRGKIRAIEAYTRQPIKPTEIAGLEPTPPKPRPAKPLPGQRHGQARGRPGGFGHGPRREGAGPTRQGSRPGPREGR